MSPAFRIFGAIALLSVLALAFVGFVYAVYRFLGWIWNKLPSKVLSIQADQLDKALAVLLALGFFPSIALYGWKVAQSLINIIPTFITDLADFNAPDECGAEASKTENGSLSGDVATCVSELAGGLARLAGDLAKRIVDALNLTEFPVASFVWFLLAAVIATQVIGLVHQEITAGTIRSRFEALARAIPPKTQQRVIFTVLVLVSFYLGLTALLAIPLFQDKSRPQQLTVDELVKSLDANILPQDVFDKRFPADLPSLREPDSSKPLEGFFPRIFSSEVDRSRRFVQDLQGQWTSLRSNGSTSPGLWRNQARDAFAAGINISVGSRQTAQHFYDLLQWHQKSTQQLQLKLDRCRSRIVASVTLNSQSLDSFRSALDRMSSSQDGVQTEELLNLLRGNARSRDYEDSRIACSYTEDERLPFPQRASFADTLGPVGTYTRWLLDTQQMPVVIIVGLVGFSLLGATVSRAVRASTDDIRAGLTLDDLLIVVAGGTTAAVVVFLAAYGGLAILGNAAGDPNPYVVFVTCLIGAVFSEDVWRWARQRVLTPVTQQRDTAEEQKRESVANQQESG